MVELTQKAKSVVIKIERACAEELELVKKKYSEKLEIYLGGYRAGSDIPDSATFDPKTKSFVEGKKE